MSVLQKITLAGDPTNREDVFCEDCCCPFFDGDTVFEANNGHGEVYCNHTCYETHQRRLLKPEPPKGWGSVQC